MRVLPFCCVSLLFLAGCASQQKHVVPASSSTFPSAWPKSPRVEIVGGDHQRAPDSTFLDEPLKVKVRDDAGNPLANAPVVFTAVGPPTGNVSKTKGGFAAHRMTVTTNSEGIAEIYYAGPAVPGTESVVQATARDDDATFREKTIDSNGSVAPASSVTITPGPGNLQMTVKWVNHASNASFIYFQISTDNVNWVTVEKVDPTTSHYVFDIPNRAPRYFFGVIPANDEGPGAR